jgi:RimJ/RimL family protein N-acetyltransferase/predicted amidohydrolase
LKALELAGIRRVKQIETERLRLRPLTPGDHDALYMIYADPEVNRYLLTQPQSREEFSRPFQQMIDLSSTLGMWAIIDKANERVIGRCGFYPFSEAETPELAYLLSPAYWGAGLATEAARRCLAYAFGERRWAEVVAMVRPENHPSARVLIKVGMQRLRTINVRGNTMDLYRMRAPSPEPASDGRGCPMLGRSIAVAQTCPVRGDVPANLEEHARLARAAGAEGAHLVVFPELSLTGYEVDLAAALAFAEDDARLSPLLDAASSLALTLIVGAPVRIGSRLHIGAFILFPNRTSELYTKQHLGAFSPSARCDGAVPPAEATVFRPGERNPLVRFAGHTAAVAVCADAGRAAHPQQAAARGARTYLASMFVIPSELDAMRAKFGGYAAQHSMMVALANFGSPSGGLAAGGCSTIWSERGELLVQLEPNGAGVAVVTETRQGRRVRSVMQSGRKLAR